MSKARDLADGTFDTDTLVVDAGNNRVGMGNVSPQKTLDVRGELAISNGTSSYWNINRDDSDGSLTFTDTDTSERLRILTGGGITFNGDTAAANALDDYEEGTWTPVDNSPAGLTFSSVSGATYVKVGNLIRVTASVTYPTTSDTNRVTIAGFPISSASGSTNGGFIHYTDNGTIPNLNMGASSTSLSAYTASGGMFSNATMSGKRIDFTMIYQTA